MKYLIIGGGVAGTTAAEELRKRDTGAQITILSEEHHPLYSRVLLPHYIKGKIPRERVFLKRETWYAEQNIEWLPGVGAMHLDSKNKYVGASDGREYPYDKLLVATGGEVRSIDCETKRANNCVRSANEASEQLCPIGHNCSERVQPISAERSEVISDIIVPSEAKQTRVHTLDEDLRGVSYCRTLDDADHFLQLLIEQGDRVRAIVYGSGFIACEYLNFFKHFEIPTTLVYRGPHFWSRCLEPQLGELIANHIRNHGVELHPHTTVVHLNGQKELTGCVTDNGEHAVTLLGIGIGIEPDFVWLRNAGVVTNAGVVVNEFLETNVPDIYAAGDIAEFFDPIVERQLQIGNWMNAMSQGRTVAKSMSGKRTSFQLVSSYSTNVLGLEVIFIGDVDKTAAEKISLVGSIESGGITQVFERGGRIVGAALIGRNKDRAPITKAIQEKQPAIDILARIG